MENYIVSARKYRPATFESVVGQSHITTTLKNAIKNNQLAQAFLFCGPRGVGKTTCARILAKTINCEHPTENMEACNTCESCTSFNDSASMNIFELDAASNNSVDDIRRLVEQVRIPPQSGHYKVYIIDEVHMLSSAAFNAFLKTLEEPPAYAKFILATTEKHKIIPTILSRCQIFDFKRIKTEDIVNHLIYVAKQEHVVFEQEALHVIAQKAEGGLRDALSMFDQLVNFTVGNLSYVNCIDNLNVLDYEYYFRLVDGFRQGDIASVLLLYQEIIDKGFDGQHFITGLTEHIRNVLVCLDPATQSLLEVSDAVRYRYSEQAVNCKLPLLLKYLEIASDFDYRYREANNKRLFIEVALTKLASVILNKELVMEGPAAQPSIERPAVSSRPNTAPGGTNSMPVQPVVEQAAEQPKQMQPIPSKEQAALPSISQKPMSQEPQTPQTPVIKMPAKASTISISDTSPNMYMEKEKKNVEIELTQELLEKWWNGFIETIRDKDDPQYTNLRFVMENFTPKVRSNTLFVVELSNTVSETVLMQFRMEILVYMRTQTGIKVLNFVTSVITKESEQMLYIPSDKFDCMVKTNPALMEYRKIFKDLDY